MFVGMGMSGEAHDDQTKIAWCNARETGAFSKDLLLGAVRASRPGDLRRLLVDSGDGPLLDLGDGAVQPLDQLYPRFLQLKPQGAGRTLLVVGSYPNSAEVRVLIDTRRRVVLRVEQWNAGKLVSATALGDFVQASGAWFAGRIEKTDAEGRRTSLATHKFTALAPGDLDRQWKDELADRDQTQFLREPLPTLAEAKRAAAAGKATVEDELALLMHFQESQQWGRVLKCLANAEKLSGKPGMRWVRYNIFQLCLRHEELKKLLFDEAAQLAREKSEQGHLAECILGLASGSLEANEALSLMDLLRPVYQRLPPHQQGMKAWMQRRIEWLAWANRNVRGDAASQATGRAVPARLPVSDRVRLGPGRDGRARGGGRLAEPCALRPRLAGPRKKNPCETSIPPCSAPRAAARSCWTASGPGSGEIRACPGRTRSTWAC